MIDKILVDTNILVYLIDSEEKEKCAITQKWLENIPKDHLYYISVQNIREFVRNCKRKKIVNKEKIKEYIELFENIFFVINDTLEDIKEANKLTDDSDLFWDALLVATMQRNNMGTILTENEEDFKKFGGIKAVNPFKKPA